MGNILDRLYWSTVDAEGQYRSMGAMIIDPVGACIQQAELSPWNPDGIDIPT
eukprot:IDg17658t1